MIYLDYAATAPLCPEAREAMEPYFSSLFGNPSNLHRHGREARRGLDDARDLTAESIGCLPSEIAFTSGGTEAINTALFGLADAHRDKGRHVIVAAIEHHATLASAALLEEHGYRVTRVKAGTDGIVPADAIVDAVEPDTILASVMTVNNETGAVQPIHGIGTACRERGVLFHTDAVQAVGLLPIDFGSQPVDAMSLSAHKFHGPKGVGMLVIRRGTACRPLIVGGSQERERRAGTENVPGIVGLTRALRVAVECREAEAERLAGLRERLFQGLASRIDGMERNGPAHQRAGSILNVSVRDADAESLLMNLDLEGISASSGSACSSGAFEPSHVLVAMGLSRERALSAVRFSLGRGTTTAEIDHVIDRMPAIVARIRALARS